MKGELKVTTGVHVLLAFILKQMNLILISKQITDKLIQDLFTSI